jgi:hypothetical protein
MRTELGGHVLTVTRNRSGLYRAKVFDGVGTELSRSDWRDKVRGQRWAEAEAHRLSRAGEQS